MLCLSLYPAQDNLVGHICRVSSFSGESCALVVMMLLLLVTVPYLSIIICSKFYKTNKDWFLFPLIIKRGKKMKTTKNSRNYHAPETTAW